jgi:hypothetical protein
LGARGGSCYLGVLDPLGVQAVGNLDVLTQFGDLYGMMHLSAGLAYVEKPDPLFIPSLEVACKRLLVRGHFYLP